MNATKKLCLLVGLVAALGLAPRTPAAADVVTHRTPTQIALTNPCNGERILLKGEMQVVARREPDGDCNRVTALHSTHVTGVGSYGNRYVLNETWTMSSITCDGCDWSATE
jgi:hypothetical protein